jgi:ATP-dependent RNA helicase DeaD
MVRLFIGAGRRQNVRPQDLVGAIANEAKLRGQDIGAIDIYDDASFVEVPQAAGERVIAALRGTTLRGHRVTVEVARPPDGRTPPSHRRR